MTEEARRRQLGNNDAPVEEDIAESFDRIVTEGAQRLNRTWWSIFTTGIFGGLEIGTGIMAYLAVLHQTGNHLAAGFAFGIGFIALLLAKSELFTEGFLVPITAVAAREASFGKLMKLWAGTLVANLVGGWIFMWLLMHAFPEWATTVAESAQHFVATPMSLQNICLALLGGSTITLMTRMQHGTESMVARIIAAVAGGFLLSGLPLFHSILDSLLIFGALHSGTSVTYLQWLGWFGYTLLFNVIGGLVLVTGLRLVRSKDLIEERRRQSPADPDAPR